MKHASSHYVRALIVLVCLLAFSPMKAQFYPPVTADSPTGSAVATAPANGGTDVQRKGATTATIQVMVWDGANPRVYWKDNTLTGSQAILGTALGTVTDPDVVTDPTGSGKTLIVYTLTTAAAGSRIYYEQIQISGSSATTIIAPTLLSSSVTTFNGCSNPNVDVNSLGNVVVTWQCVYTSGPTTQTMVFAKASTSIATVSFPATGNGTTVSSSLLLGKPSITPDVAIQYNGPLTSIVFVYNDNTTRYIYLRQYNVPNLVAGSAPLASTLPPLDNMPVANVIGRPRIAANWYTGTGSNASDAHVVVQINNNIVGYTHDASVYGAGVYTKIFENKDWGLVTCPSTEPATSYVGDFIIDTWTYDDAGCGLLSSQKTVLARQLTWDGVPHFPNYSILSTAYASNNQTTSSIAGRGATAATGNGYYLCWNGSISDMIYKSSWYMNTNLKTGLDETTTLTTDEPAAVNFSVYPNPTENNLHITFSVADGETANTIEAFDVSGKKVFAQDISSSAVGNNSRDLNTQEWTKGVYLIRVSTDKHTHTTKVVKQ